MCGETNGEWFGLWATAEEGRTELNVLVKKKPIESNGPCDVQRAHLCEIYPTNANVCSPP